MQTFRTAALALLLITPILRAADDAPSVAKRPDSFFQSPQAKTFVDNMLTWQGVGPSAIQAWPKAYNLSKSRQQDTARHLEWDGIATIDNGASYSELHILARALAFEPDGERRTRWTTAFTNGLDALLHAQYKNGGWPQRFPPNAPNQAAYAPHITFNDNAMTRLMVELQLIAEAKAPYAFVDKPHQLAAQKAFDNGIACILNCQITIDGKLTVWCAQHDENTLAPANGRAYELASLSGQESAEIADLLMSLKNPDARTKAAITAAAAWYDRVKITGKESRSITTPDGKKDRVLADAPGHTLWARFYDLKTQQPLFAGRDGQPKTSMADVEPERRTGYSWYGAWGDKVAKSYAQWKKRNP
jgi:pectinesterase